MEKIELPIANQHSTGGTQSDDTRGMSLIARKNRTYVPKRPYLVWHASRLSTPDQYHNQSHIPRPGVYSLHT